MGGNEMNYFEELNSVNVNDKTEKKNNLTYLAWAFAWGEVKKRYPRSFYTIYENAEGWNYFTDGKTCWVKTGVTVVTDEFELEHIEDLPVMDFKNQSIKADNVTSFDVNKAIQRSLTKAVARHGLGLYIYAGEDLPEEPARIDSQADMPPEERIDPNKKVNEIQIDKLQSLIIDTDSNVSKFLQAYNITRLEDMTIDTFTNEALPALEKKLALIKKAARK
jgi:hypothetical protein